MSKKDAKMYLKGNDFTVTIPTDSFYFNNDAENNCMRVKLRKMNAKFTVDDFHAHYGIFGAHGDASMTIDSTKLEFGYRLIKQDLDDGRSVPGIESCYFNFDEFDKGDLSFSVHGSFWDGFIDMFKFAFEGKIVDAIKNGVKKELVTALPSDLNKILAKTDGFVKIPSFEHLLLDFMTQEAGVITETSIEQGIRGILFDDNFDEPVMEFPVMPYKDDTIPSALQVFLSGASIQTGLTSLIQVHPVDGFFNSTMIPASSKFSLTTGFLEKAFKGISDYYGPDAPVDVHYNLNKIHDFQITSESPDLTLYADADLKFYVETVNGTELAVDLSISDFTFKGQLNITEENMLDLTIKNLKVQNLAVNYCSFGKIGTFKLKMGLNVALAVAAETISEKVGNVTVPTDIAGKVLLSDFAIKYYDGYLGVGATPTIVQPPLPPAPEGTPYASRICVRNKAGFVLKWEFKDKYTKRVSDFTDTYPIDQTKCMNINEALPDVKEGE